jgi:hypothetical protein
MRVFLTVSWALAAGTPRASIQSAVGVVALADDMLSSTVNKREELAMDNASALMGNGFVHNEQRAHQEVVLACQHRRLLMRLATTHTHTHAHTHTRTCLSNLASQPMEQKRHYPHLMQADTTRSLFADQRFHIISYCNQYKDCLYHKCERKGAKQRPPLLRSLITCTRRLKPCEFGFKLGRI